MFHFVYVQVFCFEQRILSLKKQMYFCFNSCVFLCCPLVIFLSFITKTCRTKQLSQVKEMILSKALAPRRINTYNNNTFEFLRSPL